MSAGDPSPSKSVQLEELSVPRLYFHLLRTRFTGTAALQQEGADAGTRTVWFRGGMPVFTDWVSTPDSLGELLIARRIIARDALVGALAQAQSSAQPLGQILLQGGVLDPTKLSAALRLQCARKLLHTFALTQGEVQIAASDGVDISEDLQGQVNVLQLIHRGISAHYNEARIAAEMGDELSQALTASKALTRYQAQFGFAREDAMLLRALMRGCSLETLAETQDRERAAQIVFALWTCQMLRVGEADKAAARPKTTSARREVIRPAAPTSPTGSTEAGAKLPPPPGVNPPDSSSVPAPPEFDSRPREVPGSSHENLINEREPSVAAPPAAPPRAAATPPPPPAERNTPRSSAPERAAPTVDPQRRAELEEQLAIFEKRIAKEAHPFALFDLPLDADRKAVRARWADLSKRLHPDTLEAYGLAYLRPRMEAVFAAISEAYGVLSNKEERGRLEAMLKAGGTGKAGEDTSALVKNALHADMLARDGEKQLKANRYQAAIDLFEQANALNPDDPSVSGSVAYCRFALSNGNQNDANTAVELLEGLIKEAPQIAALHYYLGMVLVRTDGSNTRAVAAFEEAYGLDKRLVEAQRQLHALKVMKRQAKKQKKKGFGGIFGR